jgi:hypothetical protein
MSSENSDPTLNAMVAGIFMLITWNFVIKSYDSIWILYIRFCLNILYIKLCNVLIYNLFNSSFAYMN